MTIDRKQILSDFCDRADKDEHTSFYFLTDWKDYRVLRTELSCIKMFIKRIQKGSNYLIRCYCNAIKQRKNDFNLLLASNSLNKLVQFGEQELKILYDIIYEYEAYLFEGNLFYALRGQTRKLEDLHDFREGC